jgi:hypothetical protein
MAVASERRGQAALLWFPIVLIFLYMTIYFMSTYNTNAALERAAERVMREKCNSVLVTLQNVNAPNSEASLMDHVYQHLTLEDQIVPENELRSYIRNVLASVNVSGYGLGFVASYENQKFKVYAGAEGELLHQSSLTLAYGPQELTVAVQFLGGS